MNRILSLAIFFLMLIHTNIQAQNWVRTVNNANPILSTRVGKSTQLLDGGFAFVGVIRRGPANLIYIGRIDELGNKMNIQIESNFQEALETFFIASDKEDNIFVPNIVLTQSATSLFEIYKFKSDGKQVFSKAIKNDKDTLHVVKSIIATEQTNFIISLQLKSTLNQPFDVGALIKYNTNAEEIWRKPYSAASINLTHDGHLIVYDKQNKKIAKIKTLDGSVIWEKSYDLQGNFDIVNLKDKGFIVANKSAIAALQNYNVDSKFDENGNFLWKKTQDNTPTATTATLDSGYVQTFGTLAYFATFDKNGALTWKQNIPFSSQAANNAAHITTTKDGGYLISGDVGNFGSQQGFLIKTDELGSTTTRIVEGLVRYDEKNNSCTYDSSGVLMKNWLVKATNAKGEETWSNTDNKGKYTLYLDSTAHTLKLILPNENKWATCENVSIGAKKVGSIDNVNMMVQAVKFCPELNVDISAPFIRRCFTNHHTVSYSNKGTIAAQNTFIEITLDSLMEYHSASLPLSSRSGQKLKFNIGTLKIEQVGRFNIDIYVKCGDSTRLRQTLCTEARIFADSCTTIPNLWSGADIKVTGSCTLDSVRFIVKNQGRASSAALNSIVVEDQVLFMRNTIQLGQGASKIFTFPANGSTWRFTVLQELNHPLSFAPTAFVEGCGKNNSGTFSTGFVTMFDDDDASNSVDVDCQPIIGSFDPNDKTGYPVGYEKAHFINQNQDIEYIIRFQNTGTDTAFTVVVRDTLPSQLDLASIQFGVSSHKYDVDLYNKGILKFTFNNINLVDSFKNEPLSHGFLKYTIKQKKDLFIGMKIENRAGIYFDFNDPVITNKALHTVGKPLVSAIFDKPILAHTYIKVYPNPFTETATFEIEGYSLPVIHGISYLNSIYTQFQLFDVTGKLLRVENFSNNRFEFDRKGLTSGLYFFKIQENGQLIGSGKLVIQ
jgi:uncharacterized repeat protein (TIGR01451 family)